MRKLPLLLGGICLLSICSTAAWADDRIIEFDTLVGVDGPFLSNANPLRGVDGGGLPWVLERAQGRVRDDGELDLDVRGLVIPERAGFGFNPAPFFRVVVSCLSVDSAGLVQVVNVSTTNGAEVMLGDPQHGDARFKTHLDLPSPCVAPILFVTSPGGAWFAATGQ
jgi:hypothetical protein